MSAELHLDLVEGASGLRLRVVGEVDLSNVGRFERELSAGVDEGVALVVDLDGVSYMDSAGIAALFARARRGRLRVVAGPDSVIGPLLRVTRLGEVVPVEPA